MKKIILKFTDDEYIKFKNGKPSLVLHYGKVHTVSKGISSEYSEEK